MKVLVTGASGAIARLVASALSPKYEWVGVDPRPCPSETHFPGEFMVADYHSRKLDDVFKKHQFDAVLHLGRIRESQKYSPQYRFQMNVVGTQKLLELCRTNGVKNLVILSTYHVYGAHRLNPLVIAEDAPLRASQSFPELSDAVEMDHAATHFMWKVREVRTTILRPTNVIGKHVRNTICSLLRSGICPRVFGFDPLMQFIDEKDLARALILALENPLPGIFNVAGEGVIALSHAIRHAQAMAVPVPPIVTASLVRLLAEVSKIPFPPYLLEFFKYPTIISDDLFRKTFGYQPKVKTVQSLHHLGPISARAAISGASQDESV
ncbi:MAG: NAD-dependent epimerase/dehydratase family protein [Bdellovibrionales bacterium]|nr:NAD-dependent epimerase/dehydratase family protein [Bdellovibrionales bacterium]